MQYGKYMMALKGAIFQENLFEVYSQKYIKIYEDE
jgi:hypothetical protein